MMMLAKKKKGVQFLSATFLTLIIGLVCFAFVNDTNLPVTGEQHSTGDDMAPSFQDRLYRWTGRLTVTGGK